MHKRPDYDRQVVSSDSRRSALRSDQCPDSMLSRQRVHQWPLADVRMATGFDRLRIVFLGEERLLHPAPACYHYDYWRFTKLGTLSFTASSSSWAEGCQPVHATSIKVRAKEHCETGLSRTDEAGLSPRRPLDQPNGCHLQEGNLSASDRRQSRCSL